MTQTRARTKQRTPNKPQNTSLARAENLHRIICRLVSEIRSWQGASRELLSAPWWRFRRFSSLSPFKANGNWIFSGWLWCSAILIFCAQSYTLSNDLSLWCMIIGICHLSIERIILFGRYQLKHGDIERAIRRRETVWEGLVNTIRFLPLALHIISNVKRDSDYGHCFE